MTRSNSVTSNLAAASGLLLSALTPTWAQIPPRPSPTPGCSRHGCDFVPREVLVKLRPNVSLVQPSSGGSAAKAAPRASDTALSSLLQELHASKITRIFPKAASPRAAKVVDPKGVAHPMPDLSRWHRMRIRGGKRNLQKAIEQLQANPAVEFAELNYKRRLAQVGLPDASTDPRYGDQWHLAAVHAPEAWQFLADRGINPGGSHDVVIAVIDTGVDLTHPDLAGNIWTNSGEIPGNGVDDDGNGYVDDVHGVNVITNSGNPTDDNGHGTHVAGIAAAQAYNGQGGVGVAFNTQIMAIKAAQYSGALSASDIAEAVNYAAVKGADVINMSFGGYARSQVEEDALAVAFGQAVLVAAAGNDGKPNEWPCGYPRPPRPAYPAALNWVIGVMASASTGALAGFSNYDCVPRTSVEYELTAPGVDIWSTLPLSQYAAWDGTSMAAPVVSGIAALLRSYFSDKNVYSSRFLMGQIASNADPVANAYAGLAVVPKPSLSYLRHLLFDDTGLSASNDNDGVVDSGETIDLAVVIRNHWGKADPVSVRLDAWAEGAAQSDPYVTMITDTVAYGAVGSFSEDDNGLMYDAQGGITGVQSPFRFAVDPNTPNGHVIPFRLTMTAGNGLNPSDPDAPYTFTSRFDLTVQRGRELPRIISQDMTLTRDDYWLVPDGTLISSGVTVTVTEGTKIEFWSGDSGAPLSQSARPFLQVEGTLIVQGSASEPVEMFPAAAYPGYGVEIRQVRYPSGVTGHVQLRYCTLSNPVLGQYNPNIGGGGTADLLDVIDHCRLTQEVASCVYTRQPDGSSYCGKPYVEAQTLSNSAFTGLGIDQYANDLNNKLLLVGGRSYNSNLFDGNALYLVGTTAAQGNVFLKNFKVGSYRNMGAPVAFVSRAINAGYYCQGCTPDLGRAMNLFRNNAVLNWWPEPSTSRWMRFFGTTDRNLAFYISDNYWGGAGTELIDAAIQDFNDDFNLSLFVYEPIAASAPEIAYPFVESAVVSTPGLGEVTTVGAEPATFTVAFNRGMDMTVQPQVSFGPAEPYTDFSVQGNWSDTRTWSGTFTVTPLTGDGLQIIRVAGARAADDPWLVTGDDAGRFRFEVVTSGTTAMLLQGTGGEGRVDLSWQQTDFDLLAGFNLYRSTSQAGTYTRLNGTIIPASQLAYTDTNVQPGQTYYYKFTVVKTDLSESGFSNTASATPIDTIPPVISHTPITSATYGLPLEIYAQVTDNVGVTGATLYHRPIGGTTYASGAMVNASGSRWSATIAGSAVTDPGIEYYVAATDGVSTVTHGTAASPHRITVQNRPVVSAASPDRGPASGGTMITIGGTNFQAGASVEFSGALASSVTVVSSNQITAVTPPHFPSLVDVIVRNPGGSEGRRTNGFLFESTDAAVSIPDAMGETLSTVEIAVDANNAQGIISADLTVTYDSSVLTAQSARAGNLTTGFSASYNTGTPGQIRIGLGGTAPVSGSGVLTYITFNVVGAPLATSPLVLASVSLNDGAIGVTLDHGVFTVNDLFDLSGRVTYYQGAAAVPGVMLDLVGAHAFNVASNSTGNYTVAGVNRDAYALTPSKSDESNGISAYDASLVLQAAVGLITLGTNQRTAADVNKSGAVSSYDASLILQRSAGLISLPFPGAGQVWEFVPAQRTYSDLNADLSSQDFTAILIGDVSGNWSPSGGGSAALTTWSALASSSQATLTLPHVEAALGSEVSVPLSLALAGERLFSADITVQYDASVVSPVSVTAGSAASDFSVVANLEAPGRITVAMATAIPLSTGGELLRFTFNTGSVPGAPSALISTVADLNEGAVPAERINGSITILAPAVDLGTAAGRPGGLACVPASVRSRGSQLAGISNEISFESDQFSIGSCAINPGLAAAPYSKQLTANGSAGTEHVQVGGNTNLLPDGLAYTCPFSVALTATEGPHVLANTPNAIDAAYNSVSGVEGAAGSIIVTSCTGDCNGNDQVTIGEVVKCVSMFLGQPLCNLESPSLGCPVVDSNLDGAVNIGEVVECVNRFLSGCL